MSPGRRVRSLPPPPSTRERASKNPFLCSETHARTRARSHTPHTDRRRVTDAHFSLFFHLVLRYRFVRFILSFFSLFPFTLSFSAFPSATSDILSLCSCRRRFSTPPSPSSSLPISSLTVTRRRHSGSPQCE